MLFYDPVVLKAYRRLGKLKPEVSKRFGTICFGNDKTYSPLQAADMLAYAVRRVSIGDQDGISAEVMSRFLTVFSDYSKQPLLAQN